MCLSLWNLHSSTEVRLHANKKILTTTKSLSAYRENHGLRKSLGKNGRQPGSYRMSSERWHSLQDSSGNSEPSLAGSTWARLELYLGRRPGERLDVKRERQKTAGQWASPWEQPDHDLRMVHLAVTTWAARGWFRRTMTFILMALFSFIQQVCVKWLSSIQHFKITEQSIKSLLKPAKQSLKI